MYDVLLCRGGGTLKQFLIVAKVAPSAYSYIHMLVYMYLYIRVVMIRVISILSSCLQYFRLHDLVSFLSS